MVIEAHLKDGVIYGDRDNQEYVYLPGSEIGAASPLFIYENQGQRQDVSLKEALRLIRVRSLRAL